ncbi:MAG: cytoplasmic protein [Candidatus Latescibacterota bacterium]|nr:MAG: cytoplasmic protein [Candidatus Latescibacterota bacterium]
MSEKIRILYAGDSAASMGPQLVASPFNVETKGFKISIWCQPVLDAFNSQPDMEVTHMPNWEAYEKFPETPGELSQYDVVILSDIESEVLLLYPFERFFQVPLGANRLKTIKTFTENGGGLVMIGGWSSFTGRRGIGGYKGTPVEEALPVECLEINDDRVEAPEGVHVKVLQPEHPLLKGIPWDTCPMFTGYNRLKLKDGAELLAVVEETGDPFIAVWEYGKGRAMAFASDIAPHWGAGFYKWKHYGNFWVQAVRWLARRI